MDPEMRDYASDDNSKIRKIVHVGISDPPVPDEDLILIYRWLDSIEFSRNKKTSSHRDFADGVMMAELVAFHIPKIINTTEYQRTSSSMQKRANWERLNSKVFRRIRFSIAPELLKAVADAQQGMIERVLRPLHLILMMGPAAVCSLSKRLENVKSRFMEPKRIFTAADISEIRKKPTRSQETTPSKGRTPSRRSRSRGELPSDRTRSKGNISVHGKNRPSTANPSDRKSRFQNFEQKSSPDINASIRPSSDNPTDEADADAEHNGINHYPKNSTGSRYEADTVVSDSIPATNSWPPVVVPEEGNLALCLKHGGETVRTDNNHNNNNVELIQMFDDGEVEEADEDIYCNGGDFDEDDYDPDANYNPKRKIKRVVKYEYREEYILNGVTTTSATDASPNANQLDRFYTSKPKKDSKYQQRQWI